MDDWSGTVSDEDRSHLSLFETGPICLSDKLDRPCLTFSRGEGSIFPRYFTAQPAAQEESGARNQKTDGSAVGADQPHLQACYASLGPPRF